MREQRSTTDVSHCSPMEPCCLLPSLIFGPGSGAYSVGEVTTAVTAAVGAASLPQTQLKGSAVAPLGF